MSISFLLALGLAACAGSAGQQQPSTPKQPAGSQLAAVAAESISAEADRPRQEMVKQELERTSEQVLATSAKELGVRDQRLLAKLLQAAKVVEELNLLQGHPKMLDYLRQVSETGSPDDRRLFERNHGPWCEDVDDVRCSALRAQPPRPAGGASSWPEGFGDAELRKLAAAPESRALLCPYSIVRRKGAGYEALAPVKDPLLGDRVRQLATLLQEAAAEAEEPTLATFLRARAKGLLSESPTALEQSDLDWVKVKGRWEVIVGPYETSRDPRGIKGRFAMIIALEDSELTAQLALLRQNLPAMETSLAKLLGGKLYKARKVEGASPRALRVVTAAGAARFSRGAVGALYLPAWGKAAEQGLSKKLLLVNHMRAFTPVFSARAKEVLDEAQAELDDEQAILQNAALHELCHGLGAQPEREVVNKQGRSTVAKALGEHAALLEELKAVTLSFWLIGETQKRFKLSDAAVKQRYASVLVHNLGLLQPEPEVVEVQAAGLLLGSLLDAKGLTYDEASGRWSLALRALPKALKELARRVETIQLTGDREGAGRLFAAYLAKKGLATTFQDRLDRPRLRAKESFAKAGIKGISLVYKVSDLAPLPTPTPTKAAPKPPAPAAPAPKKAEPAKSEPKQAGPAKASPSKGDAKQAEPKKAEPAKSEPKKAEPAKSEPKQAGPAKSEPKQAGPAKSEPKKAGPAKSEPKKGEPAKSEPKKAGPAKPEPKKPAAKKAAGEEGEAEK